MNGGLIPYRYAKALYLYAEDKECSEEIYKEAKLLSNLFFKYHDLNSILHNPILKIDKKLDALSIAFQKSFSTEFQKFLKFLIENQREEYLRTILLKYIEIYRTEKNIKHVMLKTATEIDVATEKKLMDLVVQKTNSKIELEKTIDKNIIGGFIFELDNERWDASIKYRIQRIKNEFARLNKQISTTY